MFKLNKFFILIVFLSTNIFAISPEIGEHLDTLTASDCRKMFPELITMRKLVKDEVRRAREADEERARNSDKNYLELQGDPRDGRFYPIDIEKCYVNCNSRLGGQAPFEKYVLMAELQRCFDLLYPSGLIK